MDDRFERYLRSTLRNAGRRYAEVKHAYGSGKAVGELPEDESGVRIVCRRYAERRRVELDEEGRPDCFDPDHPDCQGCVEDIREGTIETW